MDRRPGNRRRRSYALQPSEQTQEDMIAIVTHELRSPLTILKGFALGLRRTRTFNEEAVEAIIDASTMLERLVSDLLDASRLPSAPLVLKPGWLDVVHEVRMCCVQAQQATSGHEIVLELPDCELMGLWDPVRLRQIVGNLLSNAINYSDGGEILVRVTDCGTEVRVDVIDRGQGIHPEWLPHMFDRFHRTDVGGRASPGHGLGLFIAKAIVDSHGGKIWAESDGEGRGSTFSFTLPYAGAQSGGPG